MQVRHQARIIAVQALYEIDIANHDADTVLAQRFEETDLPESGIEFARQLVHGVLEYRPQADSIIQRIAPDWPVDQLAVIDRNILRLAIYELVVANETPVKVVINEAVELAKLFGSDSTRRFVNGALGTLVREKDKFQIKPRAGDSPPDTR